MTALRCCFNCNSGTEVVPQTQAVRSLPIRTSLLLRKEISNVIKSLLNDKAAGIESSTAEVLKADVNMIAEPLHSLFVEVRVQGSFSKD